jgi:hypothetical protein
MTAPTNRFFARVEAESASSCQVASFLTRTLALESRKTLLELWSFPVALLTEETRNRRQPQDHRSRVAVAHAEESLLQGKLDSQNIFTISTEFFIET